MIVQLIQIHTVFPVLNAKCLIGSTDKSKMFVDTSDKKGKKLCCPYCFKLVCKLTRHVQDIHGDETDVQKLIAIPKGSFTCFYFYLL